MNFIFKTIKTLIKITLCIIGGLATLKLIYNKLEKCGIIKSEWIIQKTPCGKGMRYVMSILDKVIVSFQV
ncbi:MAG: hypothetical protein UH239_01570 [Acutalibacteraceae bacterium]|nr:hypothetical protein [Acutalibacteraceae bacterium]